MLPGPAVHGQIIRLIAPDLHAEAIDFDVPEVLIGNSNVDLQPFDTIRIFAGARSGAGTRAKESQRANQTNRDWLQCRASFAKFGIKRFGASIKTHSSAAIPGAVAVEEPAAEWPSGCSHSPRTSIAGPILL